MDYLVPPSLLFDFQFQVPRCPPPATRSKGNLLSLAAESELFVPSVINDQPVFASLHVGWNPEGMAFQIQVTGKTQSPLGRSDNLRLSDSILLWIDTRPAGNVHRATEYCHHFAALPADENHEGQPSVLVQPIAQQRAVKGDSDPRKMLTRTHSLKNGYRFELWIPGSQLYGFREITQIGKVGFYCIVCDAELGQQPLSVDDRFPYSYDPSTWVQLELQS
jgi:hypothetical protein